MSDLLKIARAVDGDDWFIKRIQIACEIEGVPYSRQIAMCVAAAVVDHIHIGDVSNMTVETSGVEDQEIFAAIATCRSPSAPDETLR